MTISLSLMLIIIIGAVLFSAIAGVIHGLYHNSKGEAEPQIYSLEHHLDTVITEKFEIPFED